MKHTPGPWSIHEQPGRGSFVIYNSEKARICEGIGFSNACLIVAAPDLLKRTEGFLKTLRILEKYQHLVEISELPQMIELVESTLRKAKGEV